jgi:Ribonuclease G/E
MMSKIDELVRDRGATHTALRKDIEYLKEEMRRTREEVHEMKMILEQKYVLKVEFDPYRSVIKVLVGTMLTAIIGGIMTLVLK